MRTKTLAASKNKHILAQVVQRIVSNPTLVKIASFAVKEAVDCVYGYEPFPPQPSGQTAHHVHAVETPFGPTMGPQ